jgi:hypothetical protein
MDDISVLQDSDILIKNKVRTNFRDTRFAPDRNISDRVKDKLIAEGGENFFNYLEWHGLAKESSMLVLPASNHYYYDNHDLEGVTTLINQKKLNLIKHLDDFLNTIYNVLSPRTNFIGCFSDRKANKGVSLASRLYTKLINFLDLRTDIEIDRRDISRLLQSHGFEIIDMTEIDGLTYFRTRNKI